MLRGHKSVSLPELLPSKAKGNINILSFKMQIVAVRGLAGTSMQKTQSNIDLYCI